MNRRTFFNVVTAFTGALAFTKSVEAKPVSKPLTRKEQLLHTIGSTWEMRLIGVNGLPISRPLPCSLDGMKLVAHYVHERDVPLVTSQVEVREIHTDMVPLRIPIDSFVACHTAGDEITVTVTLTIE